MLENDINIITEEFLNDKNFASINDINESIYLATGNTLSIGGSGVIENNEIIFSVDNEEMLDYLVDGGIPQGQVVLCDKVIAGSNGYELGHLYRFKITYGETNIYEWEDITPKIVETSANIL